MPAPRAFSAPEITRHHAEDCRTADRRWRQSMITDHHVVSGVTVMPRCAACRTASPPARANSIVVTFGFKPIEKVRVPVAPLTRVNMPAMVELSVPPDRNSQSLRQPSLTPYFNSSMKRAFCSSNGRLWCSSNSGCSAPAGSRRSATTGIRPAAVAAARGRWCRGRGSCGNTGSGKIACGST